MTNTGVRRTGWTTPAVCLAALGGLAALSTVALVPLGIPGQPERERGNRAGVSVWLAGGRWRG